MKKRLLGLALLGVAMLSFTSCGSNDEKGKSTSVEDSLTSSSDSALEGTNEEITTVVKPTVTAEIDLITVKALKNDGSALKNTTFYLMDNDIVVASAKSDYYGNAKFKKVTEGSYTLAIEKESNYRIKSNDYVLSKDNKSIQIVCIEKLAEGSFVGKTYRVGDKISDFTFKTTNGKKINAQEALDTNKCLIINFFGLWCGWCLKEMPDINVYAEQYIGKAQFLALDDTASETETEVKNYLDKNNYTFDAAMDRQGFSSCFIENSYPLTVVIDAYGYVVSYNSGMLTASEWEKLFAKYTSDDYVCQYI